MRIGLTAAPAPRGISAQNPRRPCVNEWKDRENG
jgi:hypothetical protein